MKLQFALAVAATLVFAAGAGATEPPGVSVFLADQRPAEALSPPELLQRIMGAKFLSMAGGISEENRAAIEKRRMEAVIAYQDKVGTAQ